MADLSITAGSVLASAAGTKVFSGIAGATITAGKPLYKDTSDGNKLKLSDCNATAPANTCAGIALNGASAGQPVAYVTEDPALVLGATLTVGETYIVSATAGGIAPVGDRATGHTAINLGVALSTTTLALKITTGGVVP